MSYHFSYDAAKAQFTCDFHGELTPNDLIETDQLILGSAHFKEGVALLNIIEPGTDLSALTHDLFLDKFLPILMETADQRLKIRKIAWVIPSNLMKPIFKLWQSIPVTSELQVLQTFRTLEDAQAWLDDYDAEHSL